MTFGLKAVVFAVSVAAFVVAAKAHGMQLRLERQLAGYWEVTFGAANPAWVEALWRRERWITWGIGIAVGIGAIAYRLLATRRGWPLPIAASPALSTAWLLLAVPAVAAFAVGGLLSAVRFGAVLSRVDATPEWVPRALAWAVAWWLGTAVLAGTSAFLALRASTPVAIERP